MAASKFLDHRDSRRGVRRRARTTADARGANTVADSILRPDANSRDDTSHAVEHDPTGDSDRDAQRDAVAVNNSARQRPADRTDSDADDRVIASKLVNGVTTYSRPLCPYPALPRYSGSGDTTKADSFDCVDDGEPVDNQPPAPKYLDDRHNYPIVPIGDDPPDGDKR